MNYEPAIIHFFRTHGFEIHKISESDEERPDFLVQDEQYAYLIELKTKFESEEKKQQRKEALLKGEIYGDSIPVASNNRLSGIIRKAQSQLKGHLPDKKIIRVPWLLCSGHSAEARMDQFEATLFGSRSIVNMDEGGMRTCYFFTNSDFYRYRDSLDGAIVSTESIARLLLNPYSKRFPELAQSSLFKLKELNAVDPTTEEKDGVAYIVEGDIDRNDEEVVLSFLRSKYGIEKIMPMTLQHMSGTILMPEHN